MLTELTAAGTVADSHGIPFSGNGYNSLMPTISWTMIQLFCG
jgi:hypothetical protein